MTGSTTWLVGVHSVEGALRNDPGRVRVLRIAESKQNRRLTALVDLARDAGVPVETAAPEELTKLGGRAAHQGVAAAYEPPRHRSLDDLLVLAERAGPATLLLLLDGVQDPGNLGACLRTAECVGVTGVVLPRHRAAGLTPAAQKASAGAATRLPVAEVTNLVDAMKALKAAGIWLVGAAGDAPTSVYELDLTGPLGLVMGGEQKGLRRLVRQHCDYLAAIPLRGPIASLNVSVATGICLFEADRQRRVRYP